MMLIFSPIKEGKQDIGSKRRGGIRTMNPSNVKLPSAMSTCWSIPRASCHSLSQNVRGGDAVLLASPLLAVGWVLSMPTFLEPCLFCMLFFLTLVEYLNFIKLYIKITYFTLLKEILGINKGDYNLQTPNIAVRVSRKNRNII